MNIYLAAFYTKNTYGQEGYYNSSIQRLTESFLRHGGDLVEIVNEDTITGTYKELKFLHDNKLQACGHYAFKPLMLLNLMQKIQPGDVILYHDAGRIEYNYEFKTNIRPLVEKVVLNYEGIGLGVGTWSHNELTRDYCFREMGCNTSYIRHQNQLAANWGIYEKNPKTLKFLADWKKWCFNEEVVRTEKKDEKNHPEFKAHRWDQSILTNLHYLYSLKTLPDINLGWEKNINNFTGDTSKVKVAKTFNTPDGITLIYDVLYQKDMLVVFTSGTVDKIQLRINGKKIIPSREFLDGHHNVHRFEFDIEYTRFLSIKVHSTEKKITDKYIDFIIEKDYYTDLEAKHVLSVICQAGRNSIKSILDFVNYHLNLGIDKIIVHENGGRDFIKIYEALLPYINEGKVHIYCWKNIKFYQEFRPKSTPGALSNPGEIFHMNHSRFLFKNSKYLSCLNLDEILVPPKEVENITEYFDSLVTENIRKNYGGISYMPTDFAYIEGPNHYESKNVIKNVNNYPKHTYFPENVEVLTVHEAVVGKPSYKVDKSVMTFNHYPFLDRKDRINNHGVIGELDNVNKTLFKNALSSS